jgi:hypothetical protein
MKILFDQGTPLPLRNSQTGHEIVTAYRAGWSESANGELIAAAEAAGFEAFITTDQNLKYQQNLPGRRLSIVVRLSARWPDIEPHAERVAAAILSALPGGYLEIPI